MNTEKTGGKRGRKLLWTLLFAALNVGVIAWIALREFGGGAQNAQKLSELNVRPEFLLAGLACFAVALTAEIVKYAAMLRGLAGRRDPHGAVGCAVLGKYYDNITPLGAGGQPFQVAYLHKRGYAAGVSGALPVAGFLGLQFAFIVMALGVFFFNRDVIASVAAVRYTAYAGIVCYSFLPVSIVLFAAAPRTLAGVLRAATRLLARLHILKDADAAAERSLATLKSCRESLQMLAKRPGLFAGMFGLSVIYRLALLSMPYFVLRAFGGSADFISVFSLVVYIYAAITVVPTPGNSGAAEGSFYAVFSALAGGSLFWAVLSWRLLCYYSWLAAGLAYYAVRFFLRRNRPAKRSVPASPAAAQFVDVFYPTVDGAIRTVYSYARRLNKGAHACVVCPRASAPYTDDFDFDVKRVPAIRLPGVAYLLPLPAFSPKLKKYLREGKFDVYHAHSPFTMGRFAVRMGRKNGVPVVATFHSKYYDDVLNVTHCKLFARLVTRWIVRFYESADAVWTCSEGTADTLRGYGYSGDITVVDNGIDTQTTVDHEQLRARAVRVLGLPRDKRILLFVGHQIWQKNLKLVLDTAALLKKKGDDYLTLIVGCGYNQKAIIDYARQLGLGSSVRFVGQITDGALLKGVYLAADLFFFPSLYDNAPLVVREAAAMGLASLLVRGSNAAERVTDGVNGFTEENDCEKMAAKIDEIFCAASLTAVGRAAQKSIPVSWDDIVAQVQEKYRRIEVRGVLTA